LTFSPRALRRRNDASRRTPAKTAATNAAKPGPHHRYCRARLLRSAARRRCRERRQCLERRCLGHAERQARPARDRRRRHERRLQPGSHLFGNYVRCFDFSGRMCRLITPSAHSAVVRLSERSISPSRSAASSSRRLPRRSYQRLSRRSLALAARARPPFARSSPVRRCATAPFRSRHSDALAPPPESRGDRFHRPSGGLRWTLSQWRPSAS
jgi:hypothetical protein